MNGLEPVASSNRSYGAVVPSDATTSRFMRSIFVIVLLRWSVMPFSAYHSTWLSMICSMVCSPASTGDSRMRL